MSHELRIGLIGLDTSHAPAFTRLLNDKTQEFRVPGARVQSAFPGGSPDFALSWNRVEGFTTTLRDELGVEILGSAAAVAEASDAIIITAVDGRSHPGLLRQVIGFGKPIFIDKPFALSSSEANEMAELAAAHKVPLMSSSSLRYAEPLVQALTNRSASEGLSGADCSGPMAIEPTQPGFYWYGIHSVEMLYAALGPGCVSVHTSTTEHYDLVTGVWKDGRIGTVRGNRTGNHRFAALLHTPAGSQFIDTSAHPKPAYAGLLAAVLGLFQDGTVDVPIAETVEIIRFIEAANLSRETGLSVAL